MLSVICPQLLVFAVQLAIMFTGYKEITVKCLKGCLDIFGNGRTSSLVFGNLGQSLVIVSSLRKSSEIMRNQCRRMAENSLIY